MTKIFSKPVRVNDFIANTVNLSNENIGIYVRLLFYAWENKAMLCNIEEDIFEITKAYDEKTQEKVFKILDRYFTPYNKFKIFIKVVLNDTKNFSINTRNYIEENYLDLKGNCYFQKAQWLEWVRVNGNFISQSNAGKIGGQSKPNQNLNESESPIPIPIIKPIKKNIYIDEFNTFWGECVYKVSKGQAEKNWVKLPEEIKKNPKELVRKYNSYVSDCKIKGSFIKHPSTWFSAESYLDEGLKENIPLQHEISDQMIKTKVEMWEKGMMKHLARHEEIQKALKDKLITPEFAKELG